MLFMWLAEPHCRAKQRILFSYAYGWYVHFQDKNIFKLTSLPKVGFSYLRKFAYIAVIICLYVSLKSRQQCELKVEYLILFKLNFLVILD